MTAWRDRKFEEAPEGVPVLTLSPGGMEQTLIRQGSLWFIEDRSMYVYYTPSHWAPLGEEDYRG